MNPQNPNRGIVGGTIREHATSVDDSLDKICAHITEQWAEEHNADGGHTDVTVDTLTIGESDENGNVSGSLIPSDDEQDLGGEIALTNASIAARPWRSLYLISSIIWRDFANSIASGLPSIVRSSKNLTIEAGASGTAGTVTIKSHSAIADHTLTCLGGGVTASGALTAGTAVTAGSSGFFERSRGTALGEWVTPAYSAGDYTASSGSWGVAVGDVITYSYTLAGKTMTIAWAIQGTNVSAGSVLRLAIPGGFTAAKNTYGVHRASDAGGAEVAALARVLASGTYVELYATMAAGTWTITAGDNTTTQGTLTFEIA